MIETCAVDLKHKDLFMVGWDTGRRCNYDCTYCESTRHNNYSKHKSLDEFKKTFDFINKWAKLYNARRKSKSQTNINFTGGEPTANPNFWKLVEYIKSQPEECSLSLTTNGAWSKKHTKTIIDKFGGVTVSYHAEAHESLKKQVIENIIELSKSSLYLQVNVMLHIDYFDECVKVYNDLKALGIRCNPRPIGDGNIVRKGWFIDSEGINRRTSHEYTVEQQEWFWNEVGVADKPKTAQEGNQLGRKCCAGLELTGKVAGEWQPVKFINTAFKDWYCMVDWYFLYIDQEDGNVYHHQTCQALPDKQKGPLGNLSDTRAMLEALEIKLSMQDIKPIICPNTRCGCGQCAPKARDWDDFKSIRESIIT
jgi:MoaA/NifB/PqqE/SkfB family radical SAM enzyme